MNAKLSPEMQAAIDFANANGGTLKRIPGGFWVAPQSPEKYDYKVHVRWFGSQTIVALVKRGAATYTKHVTIRDQKPFAVEIKVTNKACVPGANV